MRQLKKTSSASGPSGVASAVGPGCVAWYGGASICGAAKLDMGYKSRCALTYVNLRGASQNASSRVRGFSYLFHVSRLYKERPSEFQYGLCRVLTPTPHVFCHVLLREKKNVNSAVGPACVAWYGGASICRERQFLIDSLLARVHYINKMISVDRSCAMGF